MGKYGRLGNSIFQAAATIALAKRNNDTYLFPPWSDAQHFNLENCFSSNIRSSFNYEESYYTYREIPYRPNMNIHGYFQSELYFNNFADEIRRIFTPKHKVEKRERVVSIHVRRRDYLQFPDHHPVLEMDYYESAMMYIGAQKYLIFSDDLAWCRGNFIGDQFEFSESNPPHVDLALMMSCVDGHIIANSSFSWWGAWLNDNPDKVVIAPKNWFGSALAPTHPTTDLIPSDWVQF